MPTPAQDFPEKELPPSKERQPLSSQAPRKDSRWSHPLLRLVLVLLTFEFLTGFAIFFVGGFLPALDLIIDAHWIAGLALCFPYALYQWRHYQRVKFQSGTLLYRLGTLTAWSMIVTLVSGIALLWISPVGFTYTVVDLIHLGIASLLSIAIGSHFSILLRRIFAASNVESRTKKRILISLVWLPLIGSVALLAAFLLWY